ncbi:molybdopterin-binding oxidoreductase, partial [Aeromonas caviae]
MGKWLGKVLLISGWLVSGMVLAEEPFFRIAGAG